MANVPFDPFSIFSTNPATGGGIDWYLIYFIGLFAVMIGYLLIFEVLQPYRKRDWLKAYIILKTNELKPLDVKAEHGRFTYKNSTYFVPEKLLTRSYKVTVRPAAIWLEDIPEAVKIIEDEPKDIKFDIKNIDGGTYTKVIKGATIKAAYGGEAVTTALKQKRLQRILTPKVDRNELIIYVLLALGCGAFFGLMLAPNIIPCPVCP